MRRGERAFTLVEVLVAVAVVALAITALLTAMMGQIDGGAYLRDKLFAQWVALNQLELARLENRHGNRLPVRSRTGIEESAGRRWHWRAEPVDVKAAGMVRWQVSVSAEADADAPVLATGSVLLDSWHR